MLENAARKLFCIALGSHAAHHFVLKLTYEPLGLKGGHAAAQLIGLCRSEPCRYNGYLHGLLLKKRYTHGPAQYVFQLFRGERHGLLAIAAAQVRMHHIALYGARPDDGYFYHQIVERPGLEPRQHRHLCAALYLEYTYGVCPADHIIDTGVVLWYVVQGQVPPVVLFCQVKGLADAGEHAQRQHIHLQETERFYIVLIPLYAGAVFHAGIHDGA